jgi:glycosyltransferase involved in cell wall biosynthesis
MNVLVVSSYPPMPCGIGAYAAQQVEALRRGGDAVDVLSPLEGEGDLHANLFGCARPARLLTRLWAYDRVWVHYTPGFFYRPDSAFNRMMTSLGWLAVALVARRRLRFIIHETDYEVDAPMEERSARRRIDRWIWRLAGGVAFHSERERDAFLRRFDLRAHPKWEIVEHGRHFAPRCAMNREEARRSLGIPAESTVFLCIGFIQPHKGFDRAAQAMASVDSLDARLYVVGSVRLDWAPAREFAVELHRRAARDRRCVFIETYVTDELFDAWIVAADCVVIPYRKIWSSGVAARAAMLGRPVIASAAGGLSEQLPEGSRVFQSDEELAEAMRAFAAERVGSASSRR